MKFYFNEYEKNSLIFAFTGALFFLFLHLLISYIATLFIPYLGIFSYTEVITDLHFPDFVKRLGNFDGPHYLKIADAGYERNAPAFFPLYPMLIKIVSNLFGLPLFLSGILISFFCLTGIIYLFPRLLQKIGLKKSETMISLVMLLSFPTSFFLITIYTEALFLLLLISTLILFYDKKKSLSTIASFFLPLTRFIGIFASILFFIDFLNKKQFKNNINSNIHNVLKSFLQPQIVAISLGFFSYMTYLYIVKNDPFAFFTTQTDFSAGRQTDLILFPQVIYRYLKIFFTAEMNFQYFVAFLEFMFFGLTSLCLFLELRKIHFHKIGYLSPRMGILLFSIFNLFIPTFTGTLSSIPRYSLLSISIFIFLGEMKNNILKKFVIAFFMLLHIILFMFFIQGYFVS